MEKRPHAAWRNLLPSPRRPAGCRAQAGKQPSSGRRPPARPARSGPAGPCSSRTPENNMIGKANDSRKKKKKKKAPTASTGGAPGRVQGRSHCAHTPTRSPQRHPPCSGGSRWPGAPEAGAPRAPMRISTVRGLCASTTGDPAAAARLLGAGVAQSARHSIADGPPVCARRAALAANRPKGSNGLVVVPPFAVVGQNLRPGESFNPARIA